MAKKRVSELVVGDKIIVGNNGEVATVVFFVETDRYSYHDAPNWCYVVTEEYKFNFHFEGDYESVEVV